MALDEQSWHEAWGALAEVVGAEAAATLMEAWPRDVARGSDIELLGAGIDGMGQRLDAKITALDAKIDGVEKRLDTKITALDAKIDSSQQFVVERIQRSEEHVVAVMRGELNAQLKSLLFGFVGLQATIGAFVVGLVRFGT